MKKRGVSPGKKLWNLTAPEKTIIRLTKIIPFGSVLDIGAGNGKHAFYLANHGFTVTAVEKDTEKLRNLEKKNNKRSKKISIINSDINSYKPSQKFDIVICTMVLHFLPVKDIPKIIRRMQKWTNVEGYNVITAYSDKNQPGKRPYLFRTGELPNFYKDWKIIQYIEEPTPWFLKPGEKKIRRNEGSYLIAKKKGV